MNKILVVDDEADLESLIRQKFRQKIREQLYEFIFALNGKIALEKLKEHPDIGVVLSDINMPEMDGLTLLGEINDLSPITKTVMVSAYGDMDNIRTAMNKGAFDFVTKPVNFTDLETTIEKTLRQVNQIKETLDAIRENNILKMYVDENVLSFMNTQQFETTIMANETIEGSVAFIDICSFTSISEKEKPDYVVNLLNNYFDVMVKEIIKEKGIVDKFIGDCIMAVFKGPYHLDRCIEACLSIKSAIAEFNKEQKTNSCVSFGINSGEMISGNIGSATLRRLDFTVIGDAVNIAQRLQSNADPNQILISEKCYDQIKQSFQCRPLKELSLKNKEKPVMVYEVVS